MTVNEAMIKFKGRCEFLQYLPAKPTKWGIKVWACCTASTYYMLYYSVQTGKGCYTFIPFTLYIFFLALMKSEF